MVKAVEGKQITLDRKYAEELKRKASILGDIFSFLEDKQLGYLMEKTEEESSISSLRQGNF